MSLSIYYLEHGRHVARLHRHSRLRRRRRARPRAIPLAMITMRKSIHGFPLLSMGMGLRLAAFRSSANNDNNLIIEVILLKHFYKLLQQFYQLLYMRSGICLFFAENMKNLDKFKSNNSWDVYF